MSNIVPQRHALNAGIWKELEQREAVNYTGRFQELWVVAGPVFGGKIRRMPSGIPIPEKFFKIIVDKQDGKARALAYLMEQGAGEKDELDKCLCDIDAIEKLTGLDFFPALPKEVQEALENKAAARSW